HPVAAEPAVLLHDLPQGEVARAFELVGAAETDQVAAGSDAVGLRVGEQEFDVFGAEPTGVGLDLGLPRLVLPVEDEVAGRRLLRRPALVAAEDLVAELQAPLRG